MSIIDELKKPELAQPFSLLSGEKQDVLKKAGKKNCLVLQPATKWTASCVGGHFATHLSYILKPDYQPEPEVKNDLIGKTVIVYDRYHFAVPLRGMIQDVAAKDGAYKISFYSKQHGYPNYLKMDHTYFFSQQCQVEEDVPDAKPKLEFVDLDIVRGSDWYGAESRPDFILPNQFEPLHCLPSLPGFVGFFYDDLKFTATFVEVAAKLDAGKKVHARFRKELP